MERMRLKNEAFQGEKKVTQSQKASGKSFIDPAIYSEAREIHGEEFYREMEQRFSDGFIGVEKVEKAGILIDGKKLFQFSPEKRQHAMELLENKMREPDIVEFLRNIDPEVLRTDFLLILRLPGSMKFLQEVFGRDGHGHSPVIFSSIKHCEGNPFYNNSVLLNSADMEWSIVTRNILPETRGVGISEYPEIIRQKAQKLHLDPLKIRRRSPYEVPWDIVITARSSHYVVLPTVNLPNSPFRHSSYDCTSETINSKSVSIGHSTHRGIGIKLVSEDDVRSTRVLGATKGWGTTLMR